MKNCQEAENSRISGDAWQSYNRIQNTNQKIFVLKFLNENISMLHCALCMRIACWFCACIRKLITKKAKTTKINFHNLICLSCNGQPYSKTTTNLDFSLKYFFKVLRTHASKVVKSWTAHFWGLVPTKRKLVSATSNIYFTIIHGAESTII